VFANAKTAKSQDRFTHLAAAAARMAVDDAKLDLGAVDKTLFGCYVGSAFGGMATFEEQTLKLAKSGPPKVSPFTIPALLGNTASSVIGIELGSQGPNFGVTSACAVGSHAIGEALNTIRRGDADIMLAAGSEAAIMPLSFAGFSSMKAMCTAPPSTIISKRGRAPWTRTVAVSSWARAGVLLLDAGACRKARRHHLM